MLVSPGCFLQVTLLHPSLYVYLSNIACYYLFWNVSAISVKPEQQKLTPSSNARVYRVL